MSMIFLQTCDVFKALRVIVPVDCLFLFGVTPVENELFSWHFRGIYCLNLQGQFVKYKEAVIAHLITYSTINELVD
jgi:hypothetical protein